MLLLLLKGGASPPIEVPVGLATETETAYALTATNVDRRGYRSFLPIVGVATHDATTNATATETDSASALTWKRLRATGVALETDAALALGAVKIRAAGLASETDTASALGAPAAVLGLATETDTASALARVKLRATGLSEETDSASTLARLKKQTYARTDETSTAQALGKAKARASGLASETDTAAARTRLKLVATGRADETDTAFSTATAPPQVAPVGRADETDEALALTPVYVDGVFRPPVWRPDSYRREIKRPLGLAREFDTAFALPAHKDYRDQAVLLLLLAA